MSSKIYSTRVIKVAGPGQRVIRMYGNEAIMEYLL